MGGGWWEKWAEIKDRKAEKSCAFFSFLLGVNFALGAELRVTIFASGSSDFFWS